MATPPLMEDSPKIRFLAECDKHPSKRQMDGKLEAVVHVRMQILNAFDLASDCAADLAIPLHCRDFGPELVLVTDGATCELAHSLRVIMDVEGAAQQPTAADGGLASRAKRRGAGKPVWFQDYVQDIEDSRQADGPIVPASHVSGNKRKRLAVGLEEHAEEAAVEEFDGSCGQHDGVTQSPTARGGDDPARRARKASASRRKRAALEEPASSVTPAVDILSSSLPGGYMVRQAHSAADVLWPNPARNEIGNDDDHQHYCAICDGNHPRLVLCDGCVRLPLLQYRLQRSAVKPSARTVKSNLTCCRSHSTMLSAGALACSIFAVSASNRWRATLTGTAPSAPRSASHTNRARPQAKALAPNVPEHRRTLLTAPPLLALLRRQLQLGEGYAGDGRAPPLLSSLLPQPAKAWPRTCSWRLARQCRRRPRLLHRPSLVRTLSRCRQPQRLRLKCLCQ